jgi:hypothetical protein
MYSASPAAVNGFGRAVVSRAGAARLAVALALGLAVGLEQPAASPGVQPPAGTAAPACDPAFAALFAPPHPRIGRYEVCPSNEPLTVLVEPGWQVHAASPLDAFGLAGTYNRSALIRLYGGRGVQTAHGWRQTDGRFESVTLLSPYPDPALRRLLPGTLIIRLILCCT